MSREIKFRGIDDGGVEGYNKGEWVYGSLILCEEDVTSTIINRVSEHGVYTDSIGQYTGLKDKNGVEIYEGDIVNHGSYNKPVFFDAGTFDVGTMRLYQVNEHCEVVGNIHETKESS